MTCVYNLPPVHSTTTGNSGPHRRGEKERLGGYRADLCRSISSRTGTNCRSGPAWDTGTRRTSCGDGDAATLLVAVGHHYVPVDLALILMKVLIVNAFAGSGSGRQAFLRFEKLVRSAFQTVEAHEQGRTEILVRHYRKLEVGWFLDKVRASRCPHTVQSVSEIQLIKIVESSIGSGCVLATLCLVSAVYSIVCCYILRMYNE